MKTTPNGLIIIRHEVLGAISDEEIIDALPENYRALPRHTVSIQPSSFELGEAMEQHWPSLVAEQEKLFEQHVASAIAENPDYELLYFGLAPITLAVHLGHKTSSLKRARVFLKDHTRKHWRWPEVNAGKPRTRGVPTEVFKGPGDVVFRFGTRFPIHGDVTEEVIPDSVKDIEVSPPERGSDIFGSHEQLAEYAGAFRDTLDAVKGNLPHARAVHLFTAIPVGLGFLLGQEISPTSHPLVYVYEYASGRIPAYYHVFTVNEKRDTAVFDIEPKERAYYQNMRKAFCLDIEGFREHLIDNLSEADDHWFEALRPSEGKLQNPFDQEYWNTLERLDSVPLDLAFLEKSFPQDEAPVRYLFSDVFLKVLSESIKESSDRELAARLFCFRQSVRQGVHKILPKGQHHTFRYPRITEEADYQADVYALLNEFFLKDIPHREAAAYFGRMIRVLTETLWAFDKIEGSCDEMEVQHTNRYLTWYYLASLIEAGDGLSLNQILSLLARKPILELRLHAVQTSGTEKLVFDFKRFRRSDLGIAVFHNGKMVSRGNEEGELPLTDLIEGFREREPEKIKNVITALRSKI